MRTSNRYHTSGNYAGTAEQWQEFARERAVIDAHNNTPITHGANFFPACHLDPDTNELFTECREIYRNARQGGQSWQP